MITFATILLLGAIIFIGILIGSAIGSFIWLTKFKKLNREMESIVTDEMILENNQITREVENARREKPKVRKPTRSPEVNDGKSTTEGNNRGFNRQREPERREQVQTRNNEPKVYADKDIGTDERESAEDWPSFS